MTILRRLILSTAALLVLAPAFGAAEPAYDEQIEELRERLEEIAEAAGTNAEIDAQLDVIRKDIARLEQRIAADDSEVAITTVDEADAAPTELVPGEQGSPAPMQREPEYLTGDDLLDDSFPGSLPIPGTTARFKIGGYAKLDFIQDFDFVGDRYEFELASIAVQGSPEYALGGQTTLHAKESRVNLDFRNVVRNDERGWEFPIRAFLEIDFFDDRDSFRLQPRLRQAYGAIGRFIAGRTWSITTDLSALAPTIDFSGGDALYGGRVSQLRFSDDISDTLKFAVGIEEATLSIGNPFGLEGTTRSSLPNLAGNLRWEKQGKGSVQLGVDLFRLEWQGGQTGPSDTEFGYGLSLTGRYFLGESGRDVISGSATVGKGAAHRVVALGFDGGNDAVITPGGLDPMTHWQVYGGYSHYWAESLNSAIAVAYTELDNSAFQPDTAIHRAGSLHVNLIWFPYKKISTGIEYMWGFRENKDGADGTANRIQLMAKFLF